MNGLRKKTNTAEEYLWSVFCNMFSNGCTLTFQQELERNAGKKLRLKFQDNRSTMLSVKWEPECTKVSLHKMFLQAPGNVMDGLACYLKGEDSRLDPAVKAYIEDNLSKLDYSHQLDLSKLETKGTVFQLKELYQDLNCEYFESRLKLHITWFGEKRKKSRKRVTLGLFHDALRLIKINRILDNPNVPEFFIRYVIFHEMVHHTCPSYVDNEGKKHIHSREFRAAERQFKQFDSAQKWIKEHQEYLFARSAWEF